MFGVCGFHGAAGRHPTAACKLLVHSSSFQFAEAYAVGTAELLAELQGQLQGEMSTQVTDGCMPVRMQA